MKLIIDINEDTYKDIKRGKVYTSVHEVPQESVLAIQTGTPIPDNATNGDIIKTLFPKIDDNFSNVIDLKLWWNAPYQKGGK